MNSLPPFSSLEPDLILDAIESLDLRPSGHLLALNSFENRVYQIGIEDSPPLIAKFYRPARWSDAQILEEHEFAHELAQAEIPLVAPLEINGQTLHHYAEFRLALFQRHGGRAPELEQSSVRQWLGRYLARIHSVGSARPFVARPHLNPQTMGHAALASVLASGHIPSHLEKIYQGVAEQALAGVENAFARAGDVQTIRLHGDCHAGNVLWTDAGPHFVDLDDARQGPAIQDIWMLLGGTRAEQSDALADFLAGYEDFREFDTRELYLIEALRTLRLIHYSAWLAQRWQDPAFVAAFPWFAHARFWEEKILELREQIALLDEAPLWPI